MRNPFSANTWEIRRYSKKYRIAELEDSSSIADRRQHKSYQRRNQPFGRQDDGSLLHQRYFQAKHYFKLQPPCSVLRVPHRRFNASDGRYQEEKCSGWIATSLSGKSLQRTIKDQERGIPLEVPQRRANIGDMECYQVEVVL